MQLRPALFWMHQFIGTIGRFWENEIRTDGIAGSKHLVFPSRHKGKKNHFEYGQKACRLGHAVYSILDRSLIHRIEAPVLPKLSILTLGI